MTHGHPAIERYLKSFESQLKRLGLREHVEIAAEIRNHCAEAQAMNQTPEAVLEALGQPHVLARAYAMELLMTRTHEQSKAARILALTGILAASGVGTLLVVMALGSIAISFIGSGIALIVIGGIEAAGIHFPEVQLAGLDPLIVMAIGPFVAIVGIGAAWALWRYMRFLTRSLRNVLGRNRLVAQGT